MSFEDVEVEVVEVTESAPVRLDSAYSVPYKDRVAGAIMDGIESGELSPDELAEIVASARKASIEREAARIEQGMKDIHRIAEEIGVTVRIEWQHKAERKKLPAKYRDEDGNEWSGRGRIPGWLDKHIAKGRSVEDFLVEKVAA